MSRHPGAAHMRTEHPALLGVRDAGYSDGHAIRSCRTGNGNVVAEAEVGRGLTAQPMDTPVARALHEAAIKGVRGKT